VGALIVGPDKRFWGMGYNGTRPGEPGCLEGACPRGRHYRVGIISKVLTEPGGPSPTYCACNKAWPCPDAVAPGSSYDTGPGACIGGHAETNAKADALRRGGGDLDGCILYVSCAPCDGCIRDIRTTTKIAMIKWPDGEMTLP
jgi:dCMP deaminase